MGSKLAQFMLYLILALLAMMFIPTITNIIHHLIFGKEENKKKSNPSRKPSMQKQNTQNPKVTKDEEIEDKKESNQSRKPPMNKPNTQNPKVTKHEVIQNGAKLMGDIAGCGAAERYIKITNYVEKRIEGDYESDVYSMTYNKTKHKITSFDAKATQNNKYVSFDQSTQRMKQIKRRNFNGKYVTTFTKQLKKDTINCVMVKIINIPGGYQGEKRGVYLGLIGLTKDEKLRNIDYPVKSPGSYLFSVKGNYYDKKVNINLDGFKVDNQDVIKIVADLQLGIISFINMTKSIKSGHVKCWAFRIFIHEHLQFRFMVATMQKNSEYQIISDTNQILSSRDLL